MPLDEALKTLAFAGAGHVDELAGGEDLRLQLLTGLDSLVVADLDDVVMRVEDVDDALVCAHLELLARVFVDEGAADHGQLGDLGGKRNRAGSARVRTAGGVDDLVRRLVQHPVVIGLEPDPNLLRHYCLPFSLSICDVGYLTTSVTTPAPTVLPPSRMANRSAGSMPIGSPRVMSITTLSPGITISTPSGSLTSPVTSVVRM